ncbi:glycosyltransferase family 4 protein [Flavisolibacter ginsenosidimutans]|uniref:Glycosyltransferase n=1 Tax=Flavisolibacter ginsenosidimutans TaxID=661481 RepID=A0A5B8UN29_9BACT|nr:glycosyltransferase family 4 protein [Flavisolibacter ginsenosidimutans]QEC57973.1 glycosyltransferase [Flavisolibacter ginsenosidimutans]
MKIAYIGTYPPRECGIGTFTQNLVSAVSAQSVNNEAAEGIVIAMDDEAEHYAFPAEVKFKIRQEQQEDYLEAARFINLSGTDVCVLEHEYGIFGGQNGIYILPLLHRLEVPLIVTLHTVLKNPSYNEKAILVEICKMAARVVVMTQKAVDFLTDIYSIAADKIVLIEHGVPDLQFNHEAAKKKFKLESKKMLLTFGFISRNKGIETVIKALPSLVKKYPETVYVVIGKTHPAVLRHSGEEYRVYLQLLVKKLQLEKHVIFLNEFISEKELFQYLYAADIYITPYLNEAQITSGTLSYAVGAGAAVLSTPYWHAEELLADERGKLFNFNDSDSLATILMDLFDHPDELKTLRKNAFAYGQKITWPKAGVRYSNLAEEILQAAREAPPEKDIALDPLMLPPFLLDHIKRMTDDTGIIQHAKFGIPNLKEGYCLDDNARALLMVLMAYKQKRLPLALELSPIYLSYIHYMQNSDGTFRNFLSFSRAFLDDVGSEDSFGRAIWSLGYLLANAPNDAYYQSGKEIFFEAAPNFEKLKSIRSIANTMIGISYYLKRNANDEGMIGVLRRMAYTLVAEYAQHRTADWHWFESLLAYDNAMLPLALLHAASILKEERIVDTAIESMNFLSSITLKDGFLSVVGNEQWYRKDGTQSRFAQQPIDALAMVLMFHEAYHLTKDKSYLNQLFTSFMWFLGENDLRMSLYDFETKGCCDGLENYGVNRNQGAESTLAYLIAHLTVLSAFDDVYKMEQA